ncbi:unnamed protein product [Porites lobata]|uniref:Uncharacterized protein n=1 Tax=Porites lobata TaxID=104759 RepID=A0ABN8N2J3_9CNID|nr:unnamed protein product [Porites lobata]
MFSGWKKGGIPETEEDLIRNTEIKRRLISELSLAVKEVWKFILRRDLNIINVKMKNVNVVMEDAFIAQRK